MDMSTVTAVVGTDDPDTWRDGDAWLAGGTVLYSYGSERLTRLLDLSAAGWAPLTATADGLEIAATCTVADLWALGDPGSAVRREQATWSALDLVRPCCDSFVASFKIWNMSTVGGNICTSLPAGPMTSLTASLDGVAHLWAPGGGRRDLPVADLVTGDMRNALRPGELLRSVRLPATSLRARTAFRRLSLSERGRSGVLVIGRLDRADDGGALVVTVTASTKRPVQLCFTPADAGPSGLPDAAALAAAIAAAIPADLYHDDVHGHPAWRQDMTYRLAEEVRSELLDDAPDLSTGETTGTEGPRS
ncbi:FAD-binding molybdopterin dehydrogenase [Paraoerskovia sediminicola]|uniref:FAD-binding molybdopterin dehydrogenase n=1 Tax=Paraoerskovia sediminicola TaxID=1138587 RepID=A0ABM8G630_9CELL|nr:FAD binding domain-containing protein [Paraoerskovia sediminicola]BDZ43607.1 FAD-binding molybdopterin dehydrogenase [Paraoerskovia sediminicola]